MRTRYQEKVTIPFLHGNRIQATMGQRETNKTKIKRPYVVSRTQCFRRTLNLTTQIMPSFPA